jgi:hypothetical protein
MFHPEGSGRTGMDASGHLPALIKKVGTEGAFLRKSQLFIPEDRIVRAGSDKLRITLGFLRIDDDDTVRATDNSAFSGFDARGFFTVHAGDRKVGNVHIREGASLFSMDVDPAMVVKGLGSRVTGPFIANELIFACKETVVAVFTFFDVDDHMPFFHVTVPSPFRPILPRLPGRS